MPNTVMLGEVTRMLESGCDVTLAAKGHSMLPSIRGGRDSVRLKRADLYEVGDVVLAKISEGIYVMHRITSIGEYVTLKGDGNLRQTERCQEADIAGKVVAIVKANGDERRVPRGRVWHAMPLWLRRILLGLYKRII